LALSAAGHTERSREAFRTVREKYSKEPDAVRFLIYAVTGVVGKVWIDFKQEFEALLRSAEIASTDDIGMGANRPKVIYLKQREIELKAIWKPIVSQTSPRESYKSEVAAYELDKVLELNMVPPTVERIIEGQPGAIQLWVHGCKQIQEVKDQVPDTPGWSRDHSRTWTFDNLIGNPDRNLGTILIGPSWGFVLIDHSRAFSDIKNLEGPPHRFDRVLIEKLRRLSKVGLQARLEGILDKHDIEYILNRRDRILTLLEQLIDEKGESAVFF
jgi:hypothetical protein